MPLPPTYRQALIATVACGDDKLRDALLNELDIIYMCQDTGCTERLRYMYTQLGLIEYAQIFARNQIDTANRVYSGIAKETYSARATRNTDSESSATGRSCNWTAATSQQNFVRTSTDDTVSFSESNSLRTADRREDGFDRSTRSTSGTGASYSRVIHTVQGRGGNALTPNAGQESRNSIRRSSTEGGTAPYVPPIYTKWESAFTFHPDPPYIRAGVPGPLYDLEVPGAGELCPPPDPDFPYIPRCMENPPHSLGQGYHGRYRFSIVVPPLGSLNLEWDEGYNERQYFHCSGSTVNGQSTLLGVRDELTVTRTTALPEDNGSSSNEASSIVHFVRKTGSSTRRGTDTIDAEERSIGVADGNAHSESNRDTKGNAFQQGRAESLTTGNTVSTLRRNETVTDDDVRRKYGQIAQHLNEMWKRIWDNILQLERELAAVPYGAGMRCPQPSGCRTCIPGSNRASFLPRSYYN